MFGIGEYVLRVNASHLGARKRVQLRSSHYDSALEKRKEDERNGLKH